MKKSFKLEDLDCGHCAAKMEEGIRKLDGVLDVSVNFLSQKLVIEAQDDQFDEVMEKVVRLCRKIEPDCRILM